nr:hypothetical protein [Tanacetum cinerariifolium]
MELYMMNIQHGRMILEFVKNGALLWPTIEENGVNRPKKYSELSAMKAIQADCDVKATNIILQGLPPEVYALVSNHKVANELWERIQLLMQGTSLTKQERECKLYEKFDKFVYKKGNHDTEMMRLVFEIKCVGKITDAFDKATGSSDGLQPEQVNLNYVYALNEPHLHEIRVVPSKHKADQYLSCADPLPV